MNKLLVVFAAVCLAVTMAKPKPEEFKKCFTDLGISEAGFAKFVEIMKPLETADKPPAKEAVKEKMEEAKKAIDASDAGKGTALIECLLKLMPEYN